MSRDHSTATIYLAISLAPGAGAGDLAEIKCALAEAARRTSAAGRPVRFVNGMYLPAHAYLLCAFTAINEEAVHATVTLTGLPYTPVDAATASELTDPPLR